MNNCLTPENWAISEFSSTIFTEFLHTTEFSSTTVFSYTTENLYKILNLCLSTTEFPSIEYFFSNLWLYFPKPNLP